MAQGKWKQVYATFEDMLNNFRFIADTYDYEEELKRVDNRLDSETINQMYITLVLLRNAAKSKAEE